MLLPSTALIRLLQYYARSKEKPLARTRSPVTVTQNNRGHSQNRGFLDTSFSFHGELYFEKSWFDSRLLMKSRFTRKEKKTSHFTFHEKKK